MKKKMASLTARCELEATQGDQLLAIEGGGRYPSDKKRGASCHARAHAKAKHKEMLAVAVSSNAAKCGVHLGKINETHRYLSGVDSFRGHERFPVMVCFCPEASDLGWCMYVAV